MWGKSTPNCERLIGKNGRLGTVRHLLWAPQIAQKQKRKKTLSSSFVNSYLQKSLVLIKELFFNNFAILYLVKRNLVHLVTAVFLVRYIHFHGDCY